MMYQPTGLQPDLRKHSLFGVGYNATNYDQATEIIIDRARARQSYAVSALAVHGLIMSYRDAQLNRFVSQIQLVVPDGQPVRWALNSFYKLGLRDRVYGPTLTLKVLERAAQFHLSVYLYGSTEETANGLRSFIQKRFPSVRVVGVQPDRFRDNTEDEDAKDVETINRSGAHIVLVGRGCPRQEQWVAQHLGKVHAVMMAVGAAFDFHSGRKKQAPPWMQSRGLEWLFRLHQEPRRLWKRYLVTNSYFIYLYVKHRFILRRPT